MLAFILELYFAATLAVSGLTKIKSPEYFASILQQQHILPTWSIKIFSRIIPWGELFIAFLLLIGGPTLVGAMLISLLFGFFLALKGFLFASGYSEDCGCYGEAQKQKIDTTNLITSSLLLILAITHLILVLHASPLLWVWRICAITLYGMGGCFLLAKMAVSKLMHRDGGASPALASTQKPDVGMQAPSFAAPDQFNTIRGLEDILGQRCILMFVLPGCTACAGALNALSQFLRAEKHYQGFVISRSTFEDTCAYAAKFENRLLFLTPTVDILDQYNVHSFPLVYILNESRYICAKGVVNHLSHLRAMVKSCPTTLSARHDIS